MEFQALHEKAQRCAEPGRRSEEERKQCGLCIRDRLSGIGFASGSCVGLKARQKLPNAIRLGIHFQ